MTKIGIHTTEIGACMCLEEMRQEFRDATAGRQDAAPSEFIG
jgi:hypothetical protein